MQVNHSHERILNKTLCITVPGVRKAAVSSIRWIAKGNIEFRCVGNMDELEGWELIGRNYGIDAEVYQVFDPHLQQMMCVKRYYFQSSTEATERLPKLNNLLRLKDAYVCQIHAFRAREINGYWALEIEMELLDCNGRRSY